MAASIIYVNSQAQGQADGSSWENAYTDLKRAIAAADNGSEIWLSAGLYSPGESVNDTFLIEKDIAIYGGFEGTESQLSRDWQTNETLLSGEELVAQVVKTNSENGAVLDGITIIGGYPHEGANEADGGGLYNRGKLTLRNATVRSNWAADDGGGIRNDGELAIVNSLIRQNTARGTSPQSGGGGLLNTNGATVTVINSTFTDNTAPNGGGIRNDGSLRLINSTLSGNVALNSGGGLINSIGYAEIFSSTITNNEAQAQLAPTGGGVANFSDLSATNSIIANNVGDDDIQDLLGGTSFSRGHNLIGNGNGSKGFINTIKGDQVGSATNHLDPQLGELRNNGGFTPTHLLALNSPAVDAGDQTLLLFDEYDLDRDDNRDEIVPFDQRGERFARIFNDAVDIGALELGGEIAPEETEPEETEPEEIIPVVPGSPGLNSLAVTNSGLLKVNSLASSDNSEETRSLSLHLSVAENTFDGVVEIVAVETDASGRVAGVEVGSAGYLRTAIDRSRVVFSVLPGNAFTLDLDRSFKVEENSYLQFGLLQSSSLDELRQSASGELRDRFQLLNAIADDSTSSDGGRLAFGLNSEGAGLRTEGSNRNLLSNLVLTASLDRRPLPSGSALQGGSASELIDLREISGTVEATFEVFREARYDNVLGFFAVVNEAGQVLNDSGDLLKPWDEGYVAAAMQRRVGVNLTGENGKVSTYRAELAGGQLLSSFIVSDGSLESLLNSEGSGDMPAVYFTHLGANADGKDHVRLLGNNTFGFEDTADGGDRDFNDLVVKVTLT